MNKVEVVKGHGEWLLQIKESKGTYIIARTLDDDEKARKWANKMANLLNKEK